MNLCKTNAVRFNGMLMADGQFLCADCVKANARCIDSAAQDNDTRDTWAALGYCGDSCADGLVVNDPEAGDCCANCYKPLAE